MDGWMGVRKSQEWHPFFWFGQLVREWSALPIHSFIYLLIQHTHTHTHTLITYFFKNFLFIYLGCVGSSLLCAGFL